MPYMRLAICFAGFIAIDIAIITYLFPRWTAALDAPKSVQAPVAPKPATRAYPYTETLPDGAVVTHVATKEEVMRIAAETQKARPELVHRASTLGDGLRCAGGIVYKSTDVDGTKVIITLMDNGKPVRCQ